MRFRDKIILVLIFALILMLYLNLNLFSKLSVLNEVRLRYFFGFG
jgi:hypothetical protein